MWSLKNCPRCSGDLYTEKDGGTYYDSCLQCGYTQESRCAPAISPSHRLRPVPLYVRSRDGASFPTAR
jgi:hypothetical protein